MKDSMKRWWRYGLLALGVLIIDRLTKWYALQQFQVPVHINQFLSFELTFNRGISWGMFHGASTQVFLVVSVAIALVTCLVASYALKEFKKGRPIIGETLVIAGSLSNLIDRAVYGGVIDFILVSYGTWSWPVFNGADMAIVLGVGLMIMEQYRS